jgi:hypothetical protein
MSENTSSTENGNLKEDDQNQASLSDFMHAVTDGNIAEAARILGSTAPARTRQLWPMRIGHLVRYVDEWQQSHTEKLPEVKPWQSHRIAVIGAGTAGLVCAGALAHHGYPVTIYEGVGIPGGVLRRNAGAKMQLSQKVLDWELEVLKRLGVEIHCNSVIGEELQFEDLVNKMNFSAIFIATGTGLAGSQEEGHSVNPLVFEDSGETRKPNGVLVLEKGKCLGDEKPVDALEHARAGTASVIQSASAGKNAAAEIHKKLTEKDCLKEQLDKDWDNFLDWCNQEEHANHE